MLSMMLQVQAAALSTFGASYKGARVDRKDLANFLDNDEAISAAYSMKFGKLSQEAQDAVWKDGMLKLAPSNRIGSACIDQTGVFCESRYVLDKNKHLVPVVSWDNNVPRPILYFLSKHYMKDIDGKSADQLLGREKMCVRLLKESCGISPVIVSDSQLSQHVSPNAKTEYWKNRIES